MSIWKSLRHTHSTYTYSAWGAGVALIGIGIKELIDRGIVSHFAYEYILSLTFIPQLDDAIAELTGKFNAATDAANGLETYAPISFLNSLIVTCVVVKVELWYTRY